MKNKIIVFIIVSILIIVLLLGVAYYFIHQNKLSNCMEKCSYIPIKEYRTDESGSIIGRLPKDKGDYWQYINNIFDGEDKNFETQKQCLEYCLTK